MSQRPADWSVSRLGLTAACAVPCRQRLPVPGAGGWPSGPAPQAAGGLLGGPCHEVLSSDWRLPAGVCVGGGSRLWLGCSDVTGGWWGGVKVTVVWSLITAGGHGMQRVASALYGTCPHARAKPCCNLILWQCNLINALTVHYLFLTHRRRAWWAPPRQACGCRWRSSSWPTLSRGPARWLPKGRQWTGVRPGRRPGSTAAAARAAVWWRSRWGLGRQPQQRRAPACRA